MATIALARRCSITASALVCAKALFKTVNRAMASSARALRALS
jgi:hypothetical protein